MENRDVGGVADVSRDGSNVGVDPVRDTARSGQVVMWEESARDGAQGKTLMSAQARVRLAHATGRVFGPRSSAHVVFAAGFPAVCREEFEATRRVAMEASNSVAPAAVCRATAADVRQACRAVTGADGGRIMVVVPASDVLASVMTHTSAAQALADAVSLVALAKDDGVIVDVCFADAPRGDIEVMAHAAESLTAAGAGVIIIADTTGEVLPDRCRALFEGLVAGVGSDVVFGSHLHNDLGLGTWNTIEAVRAGVRVLSSSWLGVAERSGLVATEQLLFLLAHRCAELVGVQELFSSPLDLTHLPAIARLVSTETGLPLTVTMPIIGTGVGTISTGTPFVHPTLFQPFDPESVLGITPKPLLTHLASARVIRAVAERTGLELHDQDVMVALEWVKTTAYQRNEAVIADEEFVEFWVDRRRRAAS